MNKYILSSILIVGICSSANGQISSYERKSVSSANELVVAAFDSTKIQWSENSLQSFIGQTFIGYCPTIDTNRGYVDIQLFTKKNDPHKRYMQFGNSSYTQCSAIEGKTFNIIDVDEDSIYKWFLLQDTDNPKTKFWYKWSGISNGPFIILSNYNYLCQHYIGKKFIPILKHKPDVAKDTFFVEETDLETGKSIEYDPTDKWECISFSQINGKGDLVAIVKNQRGCTSYISLPRLIPNEYYGQLLGKKSPARMVLFEDEFADLVEKYDLITMAAFMTGHIEKGMNVELLYLMKGKPDSINRTSYSDAQYVYRFEVRSLGSDGRYHNKAVTQLYYIDESTGEIKDWSQLN